MILFRKTIELKWKNWKAFRVINSTTLKKKPKTNVFFTNTLLSGNWKHYAADAKLQTKRLWKRGIKKWNENPYGRTATTGFLCRADGKNNVSHSLQPFYWEVDNYMQKGEMIKLIYRNETHKSVFCWMKLLWLCLYIPNSEKRLSQMQFYALLFWVWKIDVRKQ